MDPVRILFWMNLREGDFIIKNEYCVTWHLYKSWVMESMLRGQRLAFVIYWCILSLLSLGVGAVVHGLNIFWLFSAFCLYRAFLRNFLLAKKQYNMLAKTYGQENWTRTIMLEDETISVLEGTISIQYAYGDIVDVSDKNDTIWITFVNKTIIRLYKTAFVDSDWAGCKAKIASKRMEA